MSSAWTPLDDIGRSEAALKHGMARAGTALRRCREAQAKTLRSMDALLELLGDGQVDWSDATEEEAAEMLAALDTLKSVRDAIAAVPPAY